MSYLVLARKWRPKAFSEVVGQQHVLRALINGLDQNRLHHAFLFSGTRGVGKTTLARIFAKSLNCEQGVSSTPCGECQSCIEVDAGRFVDLIEVDAASRTKVDDTRELLDNVQYAPNRGRYKVYLIDEVHMLSTSSFNALLKTLEEPPPHVKFLFATTDPQKLPVTILSRCLQFNLKRLDITQIDQHLAHILESEKVTFESPALTGIAQAADGSMRDALSLLDQAISYGNGTVNLEHVTQMLGSISQDQLYLILNALINSDGKALLAQAHDLAVQGRDFNKALNNLLVLLQQINTLQLIPDMEAPEGSDIDKLQFFSHNIDSDMVQLHYQIALHGKRDMPYAADPRSGFEMTLLRMLSFQPKSVDKINLTSQAPSPELKVTTTNSSAQNIPNPKAVDNTQQTAIDTPTVKQKKIVETKAPPESLPILEDKAIPSKKQVSQANEEKRPFNNGAVSNLNKSNWLATISQLKLTAFSRQLADNTAFLNYDSGCLSLYISPELAHLATDKAKERLATTLAKYLNSDVTIHINSSAEAPQVETLATDRAQQAKLSKQHAHESIHNDPTVHAIKKAFNGHIIESTIKPLEK
jgi:DNA polymerase-3 subunit gamma/tau